MLVLVAGFPTIPERLKSLFRSALECDPSYRVKSKCDTIVRWIVGRIPQVMYCTSHPAFDDIAPVVIGIVTIS